MDTGLLGCNPLCRAKGSDWIVQTRGGCEETKQVRDVNAFPV